MGLLVAACGGSETAGEGDAPRTAAGGEAAGEAAPAPELVGEGVVSTAERNETFPAEDPVTGALWYSVYDDDFDAQTIMVAPPTADGWSTPEVAPFSGTWGDRAPRFAPDGGGLHFTSNRPTAGGGTPGDMNIWRVDRAGDSWSDPVLVGTPVSSEARDIHVALSETAYFIPSSRPGSFGRSDVFRVSRSAPTAAEHLPTPVNDTLSQPDLWISPDESWMILVVTEHPSGHGGDDLYLVRRDAMGWTAPENLGPAVNSAEYEYGPTVSRDGRHLYFTSHRRGTADIYRISLDALPGVHPPE